MEFVSPARFKIDHVHNAISFLEQIERSFILLSFNKSIGAIVQLGEDDGDLILGHSELLVIMLIKGIIFIH